MCSAPLLAETALEDATGGGGAASAIVVTANRAPTPVSRIGQSVSVIDTAALETRQFTSVTDALRLVPGVAISRSGGVGTVASVNIRGADNDQTVALIDGVKINDPSAPGGGFNFGPLLVGNISRIEVVRGSQSVLWGSQAIGGVVNMITAEPTEELAVNARAQAGWRNTGQITGTAAGRVGPVGLGAGAGWFRTDSFSAFNEARGGAERDGHESFTANGRVTLDIAEGVSAEARAYWQDSTTGIDGFAPPTYAFGDTPDTTQSRQFVGYGGLNAAFAGGRFRNRMGFAFTSIDREDRDPDTTTFDSLGKNARVEYQGIVDATDWLTATFGAERETSRYRTRGFGSTATARARLDSLYLNLALRPLPGLSLDAGVRHDDHDSYGGSTVVAANGAYTPNDGATVIRASYGEGFKVPSLFQLFSDYGNGALRPERSKSVDAGVTQSLIDGRLELSATWFRRTIRDQIAFASCFGVASPICVGRPFGTYDNIARTRAEGVELALAMQPTDGLAVRAGYTHLNAINRDNGRKLARRPEDSLFASIDWNAPLGLSLGSTVSVTGASFDNASNTRRLAGYTLVDLRAGYALGRNIELFGRIENLFDARYETVFQYGTQRRAAYAGVRWSL